ncbi:MAG: VOC family protein [Pseudomonadota bacterium]
MIRQHIVLKALISTILLVAGHGPAYAEPVADADRVAIDFRRTTLVVSDIDASLAFYRDALGMQVIYDHMIRTPREAKTDDEAERSRRLVFLRANDNYVGVLGLLQYTKPVTPPAHQGDTPFSTGSAVLLFNAHDLDSTFVKARSVLGTRVLYEPTRTEYPSYDGGGKIAVMVSVLTDPDGFVVELNQLLTDPLE